MSEWIDTVGGTRGVVRTDLITDGHKSVADHAAGMLTEAGDLIQGDRQDDYGSPEDNFNRIAELWSAYSGLTFEPHEVAVFMGLVKLSRIANSPTKADSWVDGASYMALGGALAAHAEGDLND